MGEDKNLEERVKKCHNKLPEPMWGKQKKRRRTN
jgi:hypothetical protein